MDLKFYQTNTANELVARKLRRTQIILGVVNSFIWLFGLFVLSRFAFSTSSIFKDVDHSTRIFAPVIFFFYLLLFPLIASICYQALDGKVKLLVNEKGVGYSTNLLMRCNNNPYKWFLAIQNSSINSDGIGYRQAFYNWENLSTYQFIITKNRFGFSVNQLQLFLVNKTESVIIDISQLDKSFNQLQDVVAFHANQTNVKNLGVSQKTNSINLIKQQIETTEGDVNLFAKSNKYVSDSDDNAMVIRKKKPNKFVILCIYLGVFILGMALIYNRLIDDFGLSERISWVIFIALYALFNQYFKWYYNRILFIINKNGIEQFSTKSINLTNPKNMFYAAYKPTNNFLLTKDFNAKKDRKIYLWKDIVSYEFTVCSKRITIIKRVKNGTRLVTSELIGNLLILSNVNGHKYYIGVSEARFDISLENIMAKVREVTKDMDIKDLGFSRQ